MIMDLFQVIFHNFLFRISLPLDLQRLSLHYYLTHSWLVEKRRDVSLTFLKGYLRKWTQQTRLEFELNPPISLSMSIRVTLPTHSGKPSGAYKTIISLELSEDETSQKCVFFNFINRLPNFSLIYWFIYLPCFGHMYCLYIFLSFVPLSNVCDFTIIFPLIHTRFFFRWSISVL